ncbi:MAG: Naphthoate synthase [Desulfotomaculum sp. 46_80]|nr:MAG: Naphthoate synthase [Desulfotomaculum sp. 46_80]
MKLINMVVPLERIDQEADRWCEEILALRPGCIEVLKTSFDMEIDYLAGSLGKLSGLMYPDWFTGLEIKEDQQAFFEKRKPRFWKSRIKKL